MTNPAPSDVEENTQQLRTPGLDWDGLPDLSPPIVGVGGSPEVASTAPAEPPAARRRSRPERHAASAADSPAVESTSPDEESDDPAQVEEPRWKLKTVWIRTTTGASVPTSLGAVPSRLDVRPGLSVAVEGERVVIEMLKNGRRQRVDLPSELCVLEYEAPE
jgi:hypothetical protein